MRTDSREKLASGELKWDVGLLVSVDGDDIVLFVRGIDKSAPVLDIDMQVGFVHVKIFLPHADDRGVDLYAIDGNRAVDCRELVVDGALSQTDDTDAVQLLWLEAGVEVWRGKEIIPVPAGQHPVGIGIIDGVDGIALVEHQFARAIGQLHDLNVVVERFLFVDQARNIFERPQRERDRDQNEQEGRSPAPAQAPERGGKEQYAEDQQRAPHPEGRDEPEDGQERAQNAAQRRDGVQGAADTPALLHLLRDQSDSERRDQAKQRDRNRKQQNCAEQ